MPGHRVRPLANRLALSSLGSASSAYLALPMIMPVRLFGAGRHLRDNQKQGNGRLGGSAVRYQRFRLQIVAGPARGYTVLAMSPRGEGQAPFVSPFEMDELAALKALGRTRRSRDLILGGPTEQKPKPSPEAVGERLFEALFQGEVLRLYERSLDLLGADPEAGLRLELMLDPRDAGLAAFQTLPWELMRQPGKPEFLALSRRLPIVRYLAVPRAVYTPRRASILRILAVTSNPHHGHLCSLDLARELHNLEEAVGSTSNLEIVRPEAPTLAALRRACLERECQVLHFMGHGGLVSGGAERVLFFETEDGRSDPVRGVDLVNKLSDFPTFRLVVLNACESAIVPDATGIDPLGSVASSLVLGGIPAVVAMQFPISDQAAITFSRVFYQRFAAGDPVDAAVAEGRQAVHSADPGGFEWATPVLFLRGQDAPPEQSARKRRAGWLIGALLGLLLIAGGGLAARNWWVGRIVTEGAVLFEHEQWAAARNRFQAALKLAPGRAEILSNLAATEERLGDVQAAEDHYREALRQRPASAEHLFNLGHFLKGRGRFADAYPFLLQATVREPEQVDAYGELAQAALGLGMLGRARVALSTGLRLDPERPALHRLFGELELRAGQPQAAIFHLEEARSRYALGDLGRIETSWLLIQAYDQLGNVPSACREIHEFRRLDGAEVTPWAPQAEAVGARRRCPS